LGDENIAESVIKAGMATVKAPHAGARVSTDKEKLLALQEEAKNVRDINFNPDAVKLFSKFRGTPVPGMLRI
jgi:hypothetical protein